MRRNKMGISNVFLLGMTAGVVLGSYLANRLMPKEDYKQEFSPMQSNMQNSLQNNMQTEKDTSFSKVVQNLGEDGKKDLFDTFLNGEKEELMHKANELN